VERRPEADWPISAARRGGSGLVSRRLVWR
jgi:hypothetical protein